MKILQYLNNAIRWFTIEQLTVVGKLKILRHFVPSNDCYFGGVETTK